MKEIEIKSEIEIFKIGIGATLLVFTFFGLYKKLGYDYDRVEYLDLGFSC